MFPLPINIEKLNLGLFGSFFLTPKSEKQQFCQNMFHPISSLDVNITSCFMQKSRKIYCIDYKKNLGHFLSKNLCAIFFSKKSFESILSLNNVVASRKNQKNSMQWFLENSISLIQGQFWGPFCKKKKKNTFKT